MPMDGSLLPRVLAVVTLDHETVGGGVPVFRAKSPEEGERLALLLSRILRAVVHDLENGTYLVVRHS